MAIYIVTREGAEEGELPRMIEARTKPAAIAFAARSVFGAEALTTKEALAWAKKGIELEEATTAEEEAASKE